jgi:hypothetical protein
MFIAVSSNSSGILFSCRVHIKSNVSFDSVKGLFIIYKYKMFFHTEFSPLYYNFSFITFTETLVTSI